ncbi:hypothetical protein I4U23_030781 [Adineta vaga]|nr:hypothetical protein I4U23_030781 [Adineta vaga]
MSEEATAYYTFISREITIFFGIPIFIAGLLGDIFNLIVFLSLKTFRENACAFYLTVMTAADVGQLLTGLLSRILISGFAIDWTIVSFFYCKFRAYCFQFFSLTSFVCMSLASVNQFLATSSNLYLQSLSNIKIAARIVPILVSIWLIHGILYLIYYTLIPVGNTGIFTCASSNLIFEQYHLYGVTVFYGSILPVSINGIFGILAYHNSHQLDRRAMSFVQLELDKQLISIIFVQFICHLIATVPYVVSTILSDTSIIKNDPVIAAKMQVVTAVTTCVYYLNYAIPFYMYIWVSQRFRRQFIYAFFEIYINKWRQRVAVVNQVVPET